MQSLGTKLKQSLQNELASLNQRIDSVQNQYLSELNELRSSVNHCMEKMDSTDDDFARMSKLNALKLSGIAHSANENLQELFEKIAMLIGFDVSSPSHIPEITRISKRNRTSNDLLPLPTIIIKEQLN